MSIKIQKRGGVVHNGHEVDGVVRSNCGTGNAWSGPSHDWSVLPENAETTCKKCKKHADEAERLGLHLTVAKNENGSSRVVDTRDEIAEQAAYIEEGIEIDEADAAEQVDRASYYSGTVPCFERTTVDGIGYGCVKLGEHVEHNTALGAAWWTPTECVAITKYSAHEAFATAVFNGESVGSRITKVRGRWALQYGSGHVIRAKTLGKVAKLWAKALGFHATAIDIDAMN